MAGLTYEEIAQAYRSSRSCIFYLIRSYTRNETDAEDAYQNIFEQVLRSKSNFDKKALPSTWIYGVARNVLRNGARSIQRDIEPPSEEFFEQIPDPSPDIPTAVQAKNTLRAVDAYLGSIDIRLSRVFHKAMLGDEYSEIAKAENVPIGTVRSRVSRVRQTVNLIIHANGDLQSIAKGI